MWKIMLEKWYREALERAKVDKITVGGNLSHIMEIWSDNIFLLLAWFLKPLSARSL